MTCVHVLSPVFTNVSDVFERQEGTVAGQEIPGRLQAPQLQTVGLVQLHGETNEEAQRTSEAAVAQ